MVEKNTSILYIDDDKENLIGFAISFSRLYIIHTASTVFEGHDILKQEKINLVLVDYKMPKENGISFVERIKDEFPDIIFIVVTAYAEMSIVLQALNMNCFYGFIQKPWDFNELKLTLQNASRLYWAKVQNKQFTATLEKTNRELERALRRANEADKVKTIFLQNISHEIRTPLNAIIGFSNLLQLNDDSEKTQIYASYINQGGIELLKTLQAILDISVIFSNQLVRNCVNTSVNDLVERSLAMVGEQKSGIELINDINSDLVIFNDSTKIIQIFQIIISNALKFTHSGKIVISLVETLDDDYVTFRILDTGIGIDPDKIKQIFQLFRQSDETLSRSYGGLGSGLFIAKTFVEFLEGKIWVESIQNQGSSFYFTIKKYLSVS